MKGYMGCHSGHFGQEMGSFGHHGPFGRFGCGSRPHFGPPRDQFGPPGHHFGRSEHHLGPPDHHFGPPEHHFGPLDHHFGPPEHHFGPPDHRFGRGPCHKGGRGPPCKERGPFFGESNCCKNYYGLGGRGFEQNSCHRIEQHEHPACSEKHPRFGPHGREERGPHGLPCGRPRDRSRNRRMDMDHGRHRSPHAEEPNPCHGNREEGRHCDHRKHCHKPPSHCKPCRREDGDGNMMHYDCFGPRDFGPNGHHLGPPFGGDFGGHFGHRRAFGPCNRRGPYDRCQRNSDNESGNETERRGRKKRPCCEKNKDPNHDETVVVQRIVVETAPRCNSV